MKPYHQTISDLSGAESMLATLAAAVPLDQQAVERLASLALAVEADLMRNALDFFMASRTGPSDDVHAAIQGAVTIEAAWCALLAEKGVPLHLIHDVGPPRHHAVETILSLANGEALPEAVEALKAELREFLTKSQP